MDRTAQHEQHYHLSEGRLGNELGNAVASPAASATAWTDNSVATATAYEYKVVRVANGSTGTGYLRS